MRPPTASSSTFATNVLGPYLLTELLLERLRASAPARVLFVTSGGMYTERLAIDDLQIGGGAVQRAVRSTRAAKRAEMAICQEWADELRGSGIVVHAMHPGWSDSPGIRDALPGFSRLLGPILRTPEEGVDTLVWLASAPEVGGDERAALARPAPTSDPSARAHARQPRRAAVPARRSAPARRTSRIRRLPEVESGR